MTSPTPRVRTQLPCSNQRAPPSRSSLNHPAYHWPPVTVTRTPMYEASLPTFTRTFPSLTPSPAEGPDPHSASGSMDPIQTRSFKRTPPLPPIPPSLLPISYTTFRACHQDAQVAVMRVQVEASGWSLIHVGRRLVKPPLGHFVCRAPTPSHGLPRGLGFSRPRKRAPVRGPEHRQPEPSIRASMQHVTTTASVTGPPLMTLPYFTHEAGHPVTPLLDRQENRRAQLAVLVASWNAWV